MRTPNTSRPRCIPDAFKLVISYDNINLEGVAVWSTCSQPTTIITY